MFFLPPEYLFMNPPWPNQSRPDTVLSAGPAGNAGSEGKVNGLFRRAFISPGLKQPIPGNEYPKPKRCT